MVKDWKLKKWREQVLNRDNKTCINCGKIGDVVAHHILPKSKFPNIKYKIEIGQTLCIKCHKLAHRVYPTILPLKPTS